MIASGFAALGFNAAHAQTSWSVGFGNTTSCDIKVIAWMDQVGNNCASPSPAGSWVVPSGTSTTCSFTVPSGYEFCYWWFHQNGAGPGATVLSTEGEEDPCIWHFALTDLCNTIWQPSVACKGNCESMRCTDEQ